MEPRINLNFYEILSWQLNPQIKWFKFMEESVCS